MSVGALEKNKKLENKMMVLMKLQNSVANQDRKGFEEKQQEQIFARAQFILGMKDAEARKAMTGGRKEKLPSDTLNQISG